MTRYRGKKQHRLVHPKIYIWSHTEKTEIEYFQEFKNYLRTPLLMPQKNICWTPQELLEETIKWKNKNISEKDSDQVWCIFDIDDFYKKDKINLLKTIHKAIKNGIKIAYVNECFELWILLHFEKITVEIKRGKEIEKKIQKAFKKNQKIFNILLPFQKNAIKNANNILSRYEQINWDIQISEKGNPSTSIHFLVDEINNLIDDKNIYNNFIKK